MFYECNCGTVVHLSREKTVTDEILNLVCLDCYRTLKPNIYLICYEVFPFRALYYNKVFAQSDIDAVNYLKELRINDNIIIKTVELFEKY